MKIINILWEKYEILSDVKNLEDWKYNEVFWAVETWYEIFSKHKYILFRDIEKSIQDSKNAFYLQNYQNFLKNKKHISDLYIDEYEKIVIKNMKKFKI